MEAKNVAENINKIIENTKSFKDKTLYNIMEIRDMMEILKHHIEDLERNVKKYDFERFKLTGIINEEWRSINGYMIYQVSNIGRVRNVITEQFLKPIDRGTGYLFVNLYKNRNGKIHQIHRLVAQEFLENPLELPCVDHADGNKQNNCISNLRWCTPSQNQWNKKKQENTSSKFKGVTFKKQSNKWVAQIRINNNLIHLGLFENEIDAAREYNKKATELFGEFKHLNVIPDDS